MMIITKESIKRNLSGSLLQLAGKNKDSQKNFGKNNFLHPSLNSNNQCNKSLFDQYHSSSKEQLKSTTSNSPLPEAAVDSSKENFYPSGEDHLINLPNSNLLNELPISTADINNTPNQIPNQEIHRNNQQFPETTEIQSENTLIQNEHSKNQIFQTSSCLTGSSKQINNEPNNINNRLVQKKQISNSSNFSSSFQGNSYHNNSSNRVITQYPGNNLSYGENIPSNEGNLSRYQYYEGSSNNYATNYPNNLPNQTSHQTSSNSHINHSQPQHFQQYFNEEIPQSGYNDNYSNHYYPCYPDIHGESLIEGKKLESNIKQGEGHRMTEEYQKYYYPSSYSYYPIQSPTEAPSGTLHPGITPSSAEPSKQTLQSHGSSQLSNFQATLENSQIPQNGSEQDQSYLRGYYEHQTYYPPASYYYPQTNESYSIAAGQKPSKKASFGSNSYLHQTNLQYGQNKPQVISRKSNSSKNQPGQPIYGSSLDGNNFHDSHFMPPLDQDQQIYCDPSYYCSDSIYKKPQNSCNPENAIYKRESLKETNISYLNEKCKSNNSRNSKQGEIADSTDAYGIDNQESSPQNNQSTSHEIRKRKRKNNDQLKILKIEYQKGGFWGKEKIFEVAQITGLSESQVYKWCWDQKKKRLETFKKRLGNKLITGQAADEDQEFEDMSGDGLDEDSYKQTGSPEKLLKLNDETGVVAIKANISKLSNDFTISQLQEKVLAGKSRVLQNITEKVMSRQNSKIETTNLTQILKINNNNKTTSGLLVANTMINSQFGINGQENINPESEHLFNVFQQPEEQSFLKEQHLLLQQQPYEDVTKRLHFNSVF